MILKGKHVLFFAPSFFGYEREITNKLQSLGAIVDYFDERPSNASLLKAALRLNVIGMNTAISMYYRSILNKIKNKNYDFVFIVNAEAITPEIIDELRIYFPSAKFILYMWDSMHNKKTVMALVKSFDNIYSFDRIDAEKNSNVKFRPLFFCDDYKTEQTFPSKYDLIFAGTGHADRFSIIEKMKDEAESKKISFYAFLYLHSRLMYFYQCYNDKEFRTNAKINSFSFTPLKKTDLIILLRGGKAIIDIQHPNQIGLTMRTFEVIALNKKIITTNFDIVNYDFFKPENIYVIDRSCPVIEKDFLEVPSVPLDEELKYQYSLEGWLKYILQ